MACTCGQAYDIRDCAPGQSFACTACAAVLTLDQAHFVSGAFRHARCCCGQVYDVSSFEPGQSFLCTTCDSVVVVPAEEREAGADAPPAPAWSMGPADADDAPRPRWSLTSAEVADNPGISLDPADSYIDLEPASAVSVEPATDAGGLEPAGPAVQQLLDGLHGTEEVPVVEAPAPAEPAKEIACPHCSARVDITGMQPGRDLLCPDCEGVLQVPGAVAAPEKANKGRIVVLCRSCITKVEVSELQPGSTLPCPGCGAVVMVPDTTTQARRNEIQDTRRSFKRFYDAFELASEDEESVGPSTRPTLRTGDKQRLMLARALQRTISDDVKQAESDGQPRVFAWAAAAMLAATVLLVGIVYVKSVYWDRPALRAKLAERDRPPAPPPAQVQGELKTGSRVEVIGALRRSEASVFAQPRLGALLITRGVGELWCEDRNGKSHQLFADLLKRHAQRQRTALIVTGTIRPIAELEGGAPTAGHRVWLNVEQIRFVRWQTYENAAQGVRPLGD